MWQYAAVNIHKRRSRSVGSEGSCWDMRLCISLPRDIRLHAQRAFAQLGHSLCTAWALVVALFVRRVTEFLEVALTLCRETT